MKPSEQFANLRQAAEAMGDCQDKADLLALFEEADGLHDRMATFDVVIDAVKKIGRIERRRIEHEIEWLQKWRPMLEYFDQKRQEEKVVPLQRARESDASI